jgi:hypothetical protein
MIEPERSLLIVLERIITGKQADYPVVGTTTCVRCDQMCWVSTPDMDKIERFGPEIFAMCTACAHEIVAEHPDAFNQKVE